MTSRHKDIEVEDLTYHRIQDAQGIVHEWDVDVEETGRLLTSCGIVFWDKNRSPEMIDVDIAATCPVCVKGRASKGVH
jgi:hypothetical protein